MTGVEIGPLTERHRAAAAALYWQAFRSKLGRLLGPDRKALAFLSRSLDPAHGFGAEQGGQLVGVAGFRTFTGGLVTAELCGLTPVYGPLGGRLRIAALRALETDNDSENFLIDGLSVAPEAQRQGIGSALIELLVEEGRRRGYRGLRLDVAQGNERAKALYLRRGFRVVRRDSSLRGALLIGLRVTEKMVRPL